jgi:hypothetical protein
MTWLTHPVGELGHWPKEKKQEEPRFLKKKGVTASVDKSPVGDSKEITTLRVKRVSI